MTPLLEARNVSFAYETRGRRLGVLDDLSFLLPEGRILSVVGPSGSGKTTLLSLILGLLKPDSGRLLFSGEEIQKPSRERMIVFQNHALFPWLTCLANVVFALETAPAPTADLREEGIRQLRRVGLEASADHYPAELSGGMQQRLGIARALAADPRLLLLDEPFSSIDPIRRRRLLQEVGGLVRSAGKTVILVTHDVKEALAFGDQVLVLGGKPWLIAEPHLNLETEIYAHWENL